MHVPQRLASARSHTANRQEVVSTVQYNMHQQLLHLAPSPNSLGRISACTGTDMPWAFFPSPALAWNPILAIMRDANPVV